MRLEECEKCGGHEQIIASREKSDVVIMIDLKLNAALSNLARGNAEFSSRPSSKNET